MSLSPDVPEDSSGSQSLQITSIGPYLFAYLYKKLQPGDDDQLFLRYYVKYSSDVVYHHSGALMGGYNPPSNWPLGGAGERPNGSDRFTVGFEPRDSSLRADFYTYWMHMRRSRDGSFWGNEFVSDRAARLGSDAWTCVEIMVKLNNPEDAYNGELAVWINGEPVIHLSEATPNGDWSAERFQRNEDGEPFEGFQWRKNGNLNLNFIELLNYITTDTPDHVGMVWYDDLVVARNYIGPINNDDPAQCP